MWSSAAAAVVAAAVVVVAAAVIAAPAAAAEHQTSTQKVVGSTQTSTQEQILNILREYPQTSRKELAKIIGITEDGIKKQLANLKKAGMIERIGADNGGHWEVKPKKK